MRGVETVQIVRPPYVGTMTTFPPKQVPRWRKAAQVVGDVALACLVVLLFALGALSIAKAIDGPVVVLVLLFYAIGFGSLCRRFKL